jgi:hypothetical protein
MSLFGAPASSAPASALIAALSLDDLRQLSAKPFVRQALQSREAQVSHHVSELPAPNDGSLPAAVSGLAGADSSALPTLARSGDVQQLKAFMYSDARLHTPVSTLDKALVCAVAANHPEVVKLLVAHGANIDSLTDGGLASIGFHLEAGQLRQIVCLADQNDDGRLSRAELERTLGTLQSNVGYNETPGAKLSFQGEVVFAEPFRAHIAPLANAADIQGKIAIVTRDPPEIIGSARCGFDAKVEHCRAAGAVGMLIANTSGEVVNVDITPTDMPVVMISKPFADSLRNGVSVIVDKEKIRLVLPQVSAEPASTSPAPTPAAEASLPEGGDVAADLETDETLNAAKADLNTTTALHVALDARNSSMVRLLVSLGASTHIPAGSSNTTVAEMIGRASSELAGLQAEQRPVAAGACALVVRFDYG